MINCIIVEDELPAREELKYFLNEEKEIKLIAEFDNPLDTLNFLENNTADVIFLDINMPDMNGISLGKIITKMYPDMKIVFITAYKDYAVDAFEIKAFDYLLKPYSESRIKNLLKSLTNIKTENTNSVKNTNLKKITVNIGERLYVISLNDIDYIEASEKETLIFSNEKKYVSKIKISKWEEMLKGDNFYRCHRSFIINLDKITEIEQWFNSSWIIKIKNYVTAIPVSRNNIKELKKLFSV
ncbi:LytR/AlgR family response regulator transcription factor [Fusobacterium sp. oral taxon 203]|uniref:LytR/AlgR family response regulator transcription factor n=1 Tax=Fusobacterium sp. oral taxon 203 TaxID=671211 RepID=UPI000B92B772|nr:LytTR family DNA-binding domain-containing protein [Fusobacterium sp. oral taxon 203]ASS39004.1 DNA-binding response regulator [Fusobacterium sp. oral taxon 203]